MFRIKMLHLVKHQVYVHTYRDEDFIQIDLYVHLISICGKVLRTLFSVSNIFCKPNVDSIFM